MVLLQSAVGGRLSSSGLKYYVSFTNNSSACSLCWNYGGIWVLIRSIHKHCWTLIPVECIKLEFFNWCFPIPCFPKNLPTDFYFFQVSLAARQLINALLQRDPARRLGSSTGANEIKQHPFFQSINWPLIRCMVRMLSTFKTHIVLERSSNDA